MPEKMATAHVPYLLDLALRPSGAAPTEPQPGAAQTELSSAIADEKPRSSATRSNNTSGTAASAEPKPGAARFRPKWKQYLHNMLPHAERGVNSFLLTCLAEGRVADDDDEASMAKGPAIVCHLPSQAHIQR